MDFNTLITFATNRAVHPELRFSRPNTDNMRIVPKKPLRPRPPAAQTISKSIPLNRSSPTWRASVTWPTIPCWPTAATRSGSSNGSGHPGPAQRRSESAGHGAFRPRPGRLRGLAARAEPRPTSIARHIASLKVFFRYLQLEGVLVESQAELLGSQKLWERVPKVLTPAQVARIFEMPKPGDLCWRRDRALLELLYATGCRASELSHLKLPDLHLHQDEGYCICRGKGDKERMVPLGARAAAAVKAYLETERGPLAARASERAQRVGLTLAFAFDPPWVLLSYRGRRLRRERIWELLQALRPAGRRTAGDRPPHLAAQLRHAHARRRRRPAASAGDARPRQHRHDANLHARRSRAAEGRTPQVPSASVK